MAYRNEDDGFGCLGIVAIIFFIVAINGIGALIGNFPIVMLCIITSLIIVGVIIYKFSQHKEQERNKKQQIEKKRQEQIEKEWQEKLEREKKEKERFEELYYEKVTVVFAYCEG